MESLVGQIVSIVCSAGDIVGKLEEINDGVMTIAHPRLFFGSTDGLQMANSTSATAEQFVSHTYVSINGVVAVTKANHEVDDIWLKSSKGTEIKQVSQH